MSTAYIMDTSFLLELNEIPGKSKRTQVIQAKKKLAVFNDEINIYVTVPILFEYASHVSKIVASKIKRKCITQLKEDIHCSLDDHIPWIIYGEKDQVLLRTDDIVALSERFAGTNEMYSYSFADVSIIQAKEQLLKKYDGVKILTFDKVLASHSTSR